MFLKLSQWWQRLPHPVRTLIVLFAGAASGVLKHALTQPNACMTGPCLKAYAISAVHAGVLAVLALYIPSPAGRSPWPGETEQSNVPQ
ncbi:MAG TPA: hypothetical protein VHX11_07825 [Acidobacteriaceae bacterium]|nr:hypothetical protein [Acidobacteriaceae bacterium]